MAVKLGNMLENKKEQETFKTNERKRKLETLKNLIQQSQPIVEMAKDIMDTYRYINNDLGDHDFSSKLWYFLVHNGSSYGVDGFDINPYFVFCLPYGKRGTHCQIGVGRFGVCIFKCNEEQVHTKSPVLDCNGHDKNTWYGKYLLSDYIQEHGVTTEFIDEAISALEYFLDNFQVLADHFFAKVSAYSMKA